MGWGSLGIGGTTIFFMQYMFVLGLLSFSEVLDLFANASDFFDEVDLGCFGRFRLFDNLLSGFVRGEKANGFFDKLE